MKKINFLLVQFLLVFFVISMNAQDAIIQNAAGTTSVETGNDDIIKFKVGGVNRFQMKANRLEPIGGGGSVFIGINAGQLNTGINNVGIASNALTSNTTGTYNMAIGVSALQNNTTGQNNTAIGTFALETNDVGIFNTAIGPSALRANTSGTSNISIGLNSLRSNNTGSNNLAIGVSSLFANTTGGSNMAIGGSALKANTDGTFNTALGLNSLLFNNTGGSNMAIGVNSLYSNTSGTSNIGIGVNANFNNQTGSNNTIIGYEAGKGSAAHSKSGNVFIGYRAGFNEVTDDKLYIDNSNTSSPLIKGDFASNQVGINTDVFADGYTLSVNGKMISEEVRVLLKGSAIWPDYVFKPEYKLKTLEEVDMYIKENGHLSNIPSAKEVEEEGILLGDMQKNLVEKIEELTLYMIDMNKQVKNLQVENEKLKKEVELLKK